MSEVKCEVCDIYPKQTDKRVCVKCKSMGFVPNDEMENRKKAHDFMVAFAERLKLMFPEYDIDSEENDE